MGTRGGTPSRREVPSVGTLGLTQAKPTRRKKVPVSREYGTRTSRGSSHTLNARGRSRNSAPLPKSAREHASGFGPSTDKWDALAQEGCVVHNRTDTGGLLGWSSELLAYPMLGYGLPTSFLGSLLMQTPPPFDRIGLGALAIGVTILLVRLVGRYTRGNL
jgi:hypothetical protein